MRIFGRRGDGAPIATYAAVLDGTHLWWHVPGHDRLVLREVGGSAEIEVGTDPFALDALTAEVYDLLAGGSRVHAGDRPDRRPCRTPLSADGRVQYDVTPTDGRLQVVRRAVAATATLGAVEVRGHQVHLRIVPPHGVEPGVHLVLLDGGDRVLAPVPVSAHAGHLDALLGVEDLPAGYFGLLGLGVGTRDGWVRVRRSDTALVDGHRAVLLPELVDPRHPDRPRARFRWSPESLLDLRSLDPEASPAGSAP